MESPAASLQPYPWNAWLIFRDPKLEQKFWKQRTRTLLVKLDLIGDVNGIVQGLAILAVREKRSAAFPGLLLMTLCAALSTFVILFKRAWYLRHRDVIVQFTRILAYLIVTSFTPFLTSPRATVFDVLGKTISGSNLVNAMFMSMFLMLQFKSQLRLAFAVCTIGVFTTSTYCSLWFGTGNVASQSIYTPIFDNIVQKFDTWLLTFGLAPVQHEQMHGSCFVVFWFLHVGLGFLFTSFLVYIIELYSRLNFAIKEHPERHEEFRGVWKEQIVFACSFFVIGLQVTWIMTKRIGLWVLG